MSDNTCMQHQGRYLKSKVGHSDWLCKEKQDQTTFIVELQNFSKNDAIVIHQHSPNNRRKYIKSVQSILVLVLVLGISTTHTKNKVLTIFSTKMNDNCCLIKDGASFCYCAYVLHILELSR